MNKKGRIFISKILAFIMAMTCCFGNVVIARGETTASPESDFKFDSSTGTITKYNGTDTEVIIPSTIGGVAVKHIGDDSINSPYNGVFAYSSVKSVVIPDSVEIINNYAFYSCQKLTSVTIPNSVTSIGNEAFNNCSSLTSISIPNSVTSIGNYAFDSCSSLTSVTIPDSVTSIGACAFYECISLTSVTIPNSVTSIGYCAFRSCSSLTSITVDDGNSTYSSINGVLFNKDATELLAYPAGKEGEYIIPNSVTSIGDSVFISCTGITSVTIPNSVTSIGDYAFYYCSSLTSVTISNSVTSIGDYAFNNCSSLTSVTIPNSVTSIGTCAFENCSSLTSITVDNGNSKYSSIEGVLFNKTATELLAYPAGKEGKYIIPNSVTSIDNHAFSSCSSLTSVTIPNSVTSIGTCTFEYCVSLTSVTIPDSVTSIGSSVFNKCSYPMTVYCYKGSVADDTSIYSGEVNFVYLDDEATETSPESDFEFDSSTGTITKYNGTDTEVIIPSTIGGVAVKAIGDSSITSSDNGAFANSSVTSVVIPDSVEIINKYAFYSCQKLTSVTIPNSVTSIGYSAFKYCRSLTSVAIPDSVTNIGHYAFSSCSSLTSVTIPNSVTSIGYNAFSSCSSLTSISIPNSVTTIGHYAFYSCSSLTSVTIPDSVTTIGDDAFGYCSSLISVTIPNSVTSIGNGAFEYCSNLTSVTIPNSVTTIGNYAFSSCSLTSVTIPSSVTSIGSSVFNKCSYPMTVYCYKGSVADDTSIYSGEVNFVYLDDEATETSPESDFEFDSSTGTITKYNGTDTEVIIPSTIGGVAVKHIGDDSINSLDDGVFANSSVTSVTIPDGVESIGKYTFYYCSSLTSISIPNSLTSIGDYAFNCCSGLTSITIPDSVTSIGNSAFRSCSSLTSVTIPNSVTSIGNSAFKSCSSLTSVTIPDSVTSIGKYSFSYCSSLTSISIPNSVTSISYDAFGYCSSLTSITVDNGNSTYSSIEGVLFNKTATVLLTYPEGKEGEYIIPNSVISIDNHAFEYCSSLTSVTIPDSVTTIGSYAFRSCSSLTSLTIPNSVTSIGNYAFYKCSSLTSLTIPNSVTSIGYDAFGYCSNLTSLTIPDSVTSIGSDAFYNCSYPMTVYCYKGSTADDTSIYSGEVNFVYLDDETTETTTADPSGSVDISLGLVQGANDDKLVGLVAGEDMPAATEVFNDEEVVFVAGTSNPNIDGTPISGSDITDTTAPVPNGGAYILYNAVKDGTLTVTAKVNYGKIMVIVNADGSLIEKFTNGTTSIYKTVTVDVIAGQQVYIYAAGTKLRFSEISFLSDAAAAAETTTEPTTQPPIGTDAWIAKDDPALAEDGVAVTYAGGQKIFTGDRFDLVAGDGGATSGDVTVATLDPTTGLPTTSVIGKYVKDTSSDAAGREMIDTSTQGSASATQPQKVRVFATAKSKCDGTLTVNLKANAGKEIVLFDADTKECLYYEKVDAGTDPYTVVLPIAVGQNISMGGVGTSPWFYDVTVSNEVEPTTDPSTETSTEINTETTTEDPNAITISVSSKKALAGDYVEVPIAISNNPGICYFKIWLSYDNTKLKPVSYTRNPAFSSIISNIDSEINNGTATFLWNDGANQQNSIYNGNVFTIKFQVLEDAAVGDTSIEVATGEFLYPDLTDCSYTYTPGTISITNVRKGDINLDGMINIKDLIVFSQYQLGLSNLEGDAYDAADINEDNKVSGADLVLLSRYLAGWENVQL